MPVLAQVADQQTSQANPAAAEKKICRSESETGSMVAKRTCHTKAEWMAIVASQKDSASEVRERMAHANDNGLVQGGR